MPSSPDLHWLPQKGDWRSRLKTIVQEPDPALAWRQALDLAHSRLDFIQTNALDEIVRRRFGSEPPEGADFDRVRLAILGSSTLDHLHAGIRIAALRRRLWVTIYQNEYGQYWQELVDQESPLHQFKPTAVLFALDAAHLTAGINAALSEAEAEDALQDLCERIRGCWRMAREAFRGPVLHQTALPVIPVLLGSNEDRLPGSRAGFLMRLNAELRRMARDTNADLLALDARCARDGLAAWHDPVLWLRSKQEVMHGAAPMYGELVVRLLAARRGRSKKCLVLDLDNTIWGGVVGDDGLEGLVLGQGSAAGEAFVAFQDYARELARRGVILAVCSKNDEANAWEVFERHPEMVLRKPDIASFVANWNDKASNIRAIATELNIGLDSLVFVDDNPFERDLVRRELPMVAVPEVPEDVALIPQCLADAGYFEGVAVTEEDRQRTSQYSSNRERQELMASSTDLASYLRGLDMELLCRRFDRVGLQRTVQLINKTNQFNLTTRRYSEEEVVAVMNDPGAFGLQLRLLDRLGDNGIIAIVIGRMQENRDLLIDTWLMSCRVLGRQVEQATLGLVAAHARRLGAARLIGEYRPSAKNGMVKNHYPALGFAPLEPQAEGVSRFVLDLAGYVPPEIFMRITEEAEDAGVRNLSRVD